MINVTLIIFFFVLTAVLWVWAVINIVNTNFGEPMMKLICIIGVLVFPILGPVVYQAVRKHLIKAPRKFDPDFNR
jgi:type VI protein secretion system component VasK